MCSTRGTASCRVTHYSLKVVNIEKKVCGECFFERTVDLDTYDILHNAGCRDRALCQYITMVGQGKKRRRSVVVKRGDIQTSAPVEYRSCYDCCGTPGTSGQPCNALLCHQNSTHTTASH
ncbi:uncharacterized protein LOC117340055 isoform X2 [Pecten maximus]|uniref:uncharacterized protein LOC117340055 isoform X2 n=1 Tax=Pecten maximus TaxID=6579 RepID=UPI00145806BB|nr:uncharacterized protein LOC117340055 isoform X2 [Pecten maximus]